MLKGTENEHRTRRTAYTYVDSAGGRSSRAERCSWPVPRPPPPTVCWPRPKKEDAKPLLRIGLATDLHYAEKPPGGTRVFRESLTKFAEAAKKFQEEKPDLIICLGDLIDSAASLDTEKGYLKKVVKEFAPLPGKHHFVLGNHCVENLTKPEFLESSARRNRTTRSTRRTIIS